MIKAAAMAAAASTAVGAGGPEIQPKSVLELHGGKDGIRAAMQIADAVEPFDHQGKKNEEPVHQHAVGVVMLNVLHPVKILGLIESLVLDFPAALGQFEERPGGEFGDGKIGEPIGLDDRSVLFMLPIPHDPDGGPLQLFPWIEVIGIPDLNPVFAIRKRSHCLLYTSDAADDLLCVDLGGRR